jgi:hypothetical protein
MWELSPHFYLSPYPLSLYKSVFELNFTHKSSLSSFKKWNLWGTISVSGYVYGFFGAFCLMAFVWSDACGSVGLLYQKQDDNVATWQFTENAYVSVDGDIFSKAYYIGLCGSFRASQDGACYLRYASHTCGVSCACSVNFQMWFEGSSIGTITDHTQTVDISSQMYKDYRGPCKIGAREDFICTNMRFYLRWGNGA